MNLSTTSVDYVSFNTVNGKDCCNITMEELLTVKYGGFQYRER